MGKIKSVFNNVAVFTNKNAPTILTCVGVVGVVTTVVIACKSAPKANFLLEEEKLRKAKDENLQYEEVKLKVGDYIRVCWKPYLPVFISGGLTIAAIITGNAISSKRLGVLSGLYATSEALLAEYHDQIVKQLGSKKAKEIEAGIAQDNVDKDPPTETNVIFTGYGEYLCKDLRSGQYFMSNIEKLREINNDINAYMNKGHSMSLNEVYDEIGLEHVEDGDMIGWPAYTDLDFGFDTVIANTNRPNGVYYKQPCLTIRFDQNPKDQFDTYS